MQKWRVGLIRKEKQLVPDNNDFHEAIKHRIIFDFNGNENGPTILFIGGMHGNEPAGSLALQKVGKELENLKINGRVIGINGNLKALRMAFIIVSCIKYWVVNFIVVHGSFAFESPNPDVNYDG